MEIKESIMKNLTFEDLPKAVESILKKVEKIEKEINSIKKYQQKGAGNNINEDEIMNIIKVIEVLPQILIEKN